MSQSQRHTMLLPLLILRRLVLAMLLIAIIAGVAVFVFANSSVLTKKLFAWAASKYELKYDRIEGNLLGGITLKDVRFRDKKMAKEITLRYNPAALLYKELRITKLHIIDGNVEAIKYFIASFGEENPAEKSSASSSSNIDLKIVTNDVKITTLPFRIYGINVQRARLDARHFFFDLDAYRIETEGLRAKLKSDLGEISLRGGLHDKMLQIDVLSIKDLDIDKLLLVAGTDTDSGAKKSDTTTLASPFDLAHIEKLDATIKPTHYKKIKIDRLALHASKLQVTPKPFLLKEGKVLLEIKTNIAQGDFKGSVRDNRLMGTLVAIPKDEIYTIYELPLRPGSIGKIVTQLNIDKAALRSEITTTAKALLPHKNPKENIDIVKFHSMLHYGFAAQMIEANSTASVMTPYSDDMEVSNHLVYVHDDLAYQGTIKSRSIKGIDPKTASLIGAIKVDYNGTNTHLDARIDSRYLHGNASTADMRHVDITLQNKMPLPLNEMVDLPLEINAAKIHHLEAKTQIDLKEPLQTKPHLTLDSDLIAADLRGSFETASVITGEIRIPKDSLLRSYQPKIQWDHLDPITLSSTIDRQAAKLSLRSKALKADIHYRLLKKTVGAKVTLGTLKITALGDPQKEIALHTKVQSAKSLRHSMVQIYALDTEFPPVEGVLKLDGKIIKLQSAHITLQSPKLTYKPKRGNKQKIEDLLVEIQANKQGIELSRYHLIYNKQKFFATKPSKIVLNEQKIVLPSLWINDSLKISGTYDPKKAQGKFVTQSERFHIKEGIVDLYTKIDIDTKIDGNAIDSKGEIVLLGGKVTPNIGSKSFASDSDIIILQDQKEKTQSDLMKQLSLMLKVTAEKPVILKQPDLYAKLKPDLTILKESGKNEILYLGSVELLEGGYYRFNDKKFVLKRSHIYFTGDVNKPLLDIKATYQSAQYLITIRVTGTPNAPKINFSSSPPLTREQILSVILFDTEEAAGAHTGDEMMRMMGGVMAKAALSNLGVKIDYLVIGEDGSLEIGKKINDKITVIYINGEEPQIKIKYKHNRHMESVIGASQKSESYDIIFKGDF